MIWISYFRWTDNWYRRAHFMSSWFAWEYIRTENEERIQRSSVALFPVLFSYTHTYTHISCLMVGNDIKWTNNEHIHASKVCRIVYVSRLTKEAFALNGWKRKKITSSHSKHNHMHADRSRMNIPKTETETHIPVVHERSKTTHYTNVKPTKVTTEMSIRETYKLHSTHQGRRCDFAWW